MTTWNRKTMFSTITVDMVNSKELNVSFPTTLTFSSIVVNYLLTNFLVTLFTSEVRKLSMSVMPFLRSFTLLIWSGMMIFFSSFKNIIFMFLVVLFVVFSSISEIVCFHTNNYIILRKV